MRAACAVLAALAWPGVAAAAEIHRCPQPDGTTRFQDRPCAAEPARSPARAPEAEPRSGAASGTTNGAARSAPAPAPAMSAAPSPRPAPREAPPLADSRADYVARNAVRCRDGDRRACAAVTCERSGRLDSPACQEAVGYLRGPGWELRPTSDLFDPTRASDEFTLTCRATARRARLSRARGTEVYAWPAESAAAGPAVARDVARAALPDAAREFCAGR
jgi:hypothetical protein